MNPSAFGFALFALLTASACGGNSNPAGPSGPSQSVNVPFSITTLREGTGPQAAAGNALTVGYRGWLYSTNATDNKGELFDSSSLPGRTPLPIVLGVTSLIQGFVQGVTGMRVGEVRRVIIPPSLGYGSTGRPPDIPPNATLVFEIELLTLVQ